jgi:hypothetical protein
MERAIAIIDYLLAKLESKLTSYGVGILVGAVLLAAAHIYINPVLAPVYHGVNYTQLSNNPFNFTANNPVQNRILTPLVAHYLGFTGPHYMNFIRVIGVLFLAAVYIAARHRSIPAVNAFLGSSIFAFTLPIINFIRFPGYTDITSYLCIFLAMVTVQRLWLWPIFLALAVLNHESNIFVLPWFFLFHAISNKGRWLTIAASAAALALTVVPWYLWIMYAKKLSAPEYSPEFYLNAHLWGKFSTVAARYYSGLFATFKILWILPALAVWWALSKRQNLIEALSTVALYIAIVACATGQLFLAHDTSRLLTLAFPAVWLGFLQLNQQLSASKSAYVLAWLILINLFIPNYMCGTNYDPVFLLHSAPGSWILRHYFYQNIR